MRRTIGVRITSTLWHALGPILWAVLSSAFATEAHAQPLLDENRLYQQVLTSPRWQDVSRQLIAKYIKPIEQSELDGYCRVAISLLVHRSDGDAVDVCIHAAIEGLHSTSRYYSADEIRRQSEDAKRKFVGIGMELKAHAGGTGYVQVVSALNGSPAEKAGIKSGDLIYSVDGVSTTALSLNDAVHVMRGEAGSNMTLLVRREGEQSPLKFVVTRQPITIKTVKSKLFSPGTAYLRLSQFSDSTRNDVIDEVAKLKASNGGRLDSLILDLRNCQGGLLNATVGVASLFVESDTEILRVVERLESQNRVYRASPKDYASNVVAQHSEPVDWPLKSLRLAVLVNGKTASGAEALAQTLKDQRHALIFGQPTLGLATIDTFFALDSGAAMRVTTGEMFTARGRSWREHGVDLDFSTPADDDKKWEFGELPDDAQLAAVMDQFSRH